VFKRDRLAKPKGLLVMMQRTRHVPDLPVQYGEVVVRFPQSR
jgi:hypothetical protein